jgi:hypothetical protein
MTSWRKAILYGILVWLVPFIVAFVCFPLKLKWRSLFESIMPLTLAVVVVPLAVRYVRAAGAVSVKEGVALGFVWLAISVLIDLPLMLSPPIRMAPSEYAADIALTYVMIPVITAGIAAASGSARAPKPRVPT